MNWAYNSAISTHLAGEVGRGCGVFKQDDGKWYGNAVVAGEHHGVGPCETLDEVKKAAEEEFVHMVQYLEEDNVEEE